MKFWKSLLYIYIVAVTAACAVFGVLYFLGVPSPAAKALTYEEARSLVNTVYSAEIPLKSAKAGDVSSQSMTEEDYLADVFEESERTVNLPVYKQYLKLMKLIFEENWAIDTWYRDSRFDNDQYYFKYYIQGQSVCIQEASNTDQSDRTYFPHGIMIVLTKTGEKSWKSEMIARTVTTVGVDDNGELRSGCVLAGLSFEAENDNDVYLFSDFGTSFKVEDIVTEKISDTSLIESSGIYRCNLKTHKVLDRFSDEKQALLTDKEKLKITNDLIDRTNQFCPIRHSSDFGDNVPMSDIYDRVMG